MAENTRKVLINRHSPRPVAPSPDSMYHGEIAVSHPENLSATTIYTKNGNVMVPFASCAMTMTMIDNAIDAANVTYDVKAADKDAHIEVASGGTGQAKVFTVSSKDVQSKKEFDAYSAATKTRIDNITSAVDSLIDDVVTGITGDGVVIATKVENGSGSNSYNLTHKPGLETNGFKKLKTDKYGHVTASEDVVTADIERLGFKTSTATTTEIAAAIEALSAVSASTGKYFTAIGVKDGKLVKEEAELPKLSSASTGDGNVVTDIQVTDHEITLVKGMTVASDADLKAVSGIVNTFSAATVHEFDSAFTAINALSGDVVSYVKSVSGNIESVINAMDKGAEVLAGQVVTTVSQENGKVAETKANVKDLQLGGYSKDPNATGPIGTTDTINAALSKLENIIAANAISNKDGSIVVTEPTGTATTTDIKVNIKSGEKVIKLGNEGLYTNLNLVKLTESLPATVKERYEFRDSENNKIGESIDIAKDSHIVSITYDESAQTLIYKYMDVEGTEKTVKVNMAHLVLETEVENGVQSNNGKLSIKLDTTGNDTGDGKFLTVGADGLKLNGVSDAIAAAVNALDVTDAAVKGQYVSSVSETDGKIAVSRANVSDAVLNGYAKGEKPASTEITVDDTVKGAISKLEHQIDAAKAAATTKVVEGTDAGNNMEIVPTAGNDGSVTYTVSLTDVASKNALDAEIAARKAVDGQDGDTYAKNTSANYISAATSLNDADVKLDAALKAEENARTSQDNKIEASIGLAEDGSHVKTNGTYTSSATTVVGEIAALDKALKEVSDAVNGLDYTGLTNENTKVVTDVKQENGLVSANATTVGDLVITAITASDDRVAANDSLATIAGKLQGQIDAMDSTGQTTGNGYFLTSVQIADGKITAVTQSDKVNSASTAAHADAAAKVDQKLTFSDETTDVEYDGSSAQTITFGSPVNATDITGRSLSITNGVVDVEIIDCGEY